MLGLKGGCQITAQERASVVIVAHFADFNTSWVSHISQKLREEYKDLIAAGQFHGIHAKEERSVLKILWTPFSYSKKPRTTWHAFQQTKTATCKKTSKHAGIPPCFGRN